MATQPGQLAEKVDVEFSRPEKVCLLSEISLVWGCGRSIGLELGDLAVASGMPLPLPGS